MEHPYSIAKQHETFISMESMARASWLNMRLPAQIFPPTIFGRTSTDAEIYTSVDTFTKNNAITHEREQTDLTHCLTGVFFPICS